MTMRTLLKCESNEKKYTYIIFLKITHLAISFRIILANILFPSFSPKMIYLKGINMKDNKIHFIH